MIKQQPTPAEIERFNSKWTGQKFGFLTITGLSHYVIYQNRKTGKNFPKTYRVFVDCDCGTKGKAVSLSNLIAGLQKGCGKDCQCTKSLRGRGPDPKPKPVKESREITIERKFQEKYVSKKYGFWTILRSHERTKTGRYVVARCECGIKKVVRLHSIVSGQSRTCGSTECREKAGIYLGKHLSKMPYHEKHPKPREPYFLKSFDKKYLGKRYGNLVITGYSHHEDHTSVGGRKYKKHMVVCRCDCGNDKVVNINDLNAGLAVRCGHYCKLRPRKKQCQKGPKKYQTEKQRHDFLKPRQFKDLQGYLDDRPTTNQKTVEPYCFKPDENYIPKESSHENYERNEVVEFLKRNLKK